MRRHLVSLALLVVPALLAQTSGSVSSVLEQLNSSLLEPRGEDRDLLERRASSLLQLMETDPAKAVTLALPEARLQELRGKYPKALIESRGEWSGPIRSFVAHEKETSRIIRQMEVEGRMVSVHWVQESPGDCGAIYNVRGIRLGDSIAVDSATVIGKQITSGECSPLGEQKTAVILLTFPSAPLDPSVTVASMREAFFGAAPSVNEYLKSFSYGAASASGDVFGPFTISENYACDSTSIFSAAIRAADAVDLRGYSRLFFIPPPTAPCFGDERQLYRDLTSLSCLTWTSPARGPFSASVAWVYAPRGASGTTVPVGSVQSYALHAMGHQFGLLHAREFSWAGEYPLGAPGDHGSVFESGDFFSNMGWLTDGGHWAAPHKVLLGWLQRPQNVVEVESSGTFRLQPFEKKESGLPHALRVKRPGTNAWLWLEYRRRGPTGDGLLYPGAAVHYEDATDACTNVLSFGPMTWRSTAYLLSPGQAWSDPYSPLTLRADSAGPESLEVKVGYETTCATLSTSSRIHGPEMETGQIVVSASDGCPWTVSSNNNSWIEITGPQSGAGNGVVSYALVNPNLTSIPRTGSITLAKQTVSITQNPGCMITGKASTWYSDGGVSGVTIAISGSRTGTILTPQGGNFCFANLDPSGVYTITPSQSWFTFEPRSVTFKGITGPVTANFIGRYNATAVGWISRDGKGLPGVAVNLSGAANRSTLTLSDGSYRFDGLLSGLTYSITPRLAGYVFSPDAVSVTPPDNSNSTVYTAFTAKAVPELDIASLRTGEYRPGGSLSYQVTISNPGVIPVQGEIWVSASLPQGMVFRSIVAPPSWTCTLPFGCGRADGLAPGASFPPLTFNYDISRNAPSMAPYDVHVYWSANGVEASKQVSEILRTPTGGTLSISKTHVGSFRQGQTGATYTITVANSDQAAPTSGAVSVVENPPSGLTLVGMSGPGWTCSGVTCTRSDALNPGASYPPIRVNVNVAANAPSLVTNQATVSGGGSAPATANDPTTVLAGAPAFSVTKTHDGFFFQGQAGASYVVTVSKPSTAAPDNGLVTVTDTLPNGLILASMSGTGWNCSSNSCSRGDALTPGASYPPIIVTVNVAASAATEVTNRVAVLVDGSPVASASDLTEIRTKAPILSISLSHSGNFSAGQTGAMYTVSVTNAMTGGPTAGKATVTEIVPPGLILVSMSGSGWTCASNTCTRNDSLTAGDSYPSIRVSVNVAPDAPARVTNQVTVAGGGSVPASASDETSIEAAGGLKILKSHTGNFSQGERGAVYTVTVSRPASTPAPAGVIAVTELIPPGLTLVSMSGTGWTCSTNQCTRSDSLASGATYPPIAVIVDVAMNAPSQLTNQVNLHVDGKLTATAADPTTIVGRPGR